MVGVMILKVMWSVGLPMLIGYCLRLLQERWMARVRVVTQLELEGEKRRELLAAATTDELLALLSKRRELIE